jgi:phospholipid/cholesterol/gamma-HCH transport system substrate-binding protein
MSRLVRLIAPLVIVMLVVAAFVSFTDKPSPRHVSAYFSRAVSIYKGSEVRVMGVKIGTVTSVVPEGDQVRVSMEYDPQYKLPAGAKAAIITPTLTADRFVQIAPSYTGGPQLKDGARIALPDTGTPVELDRISQALSDLTQALGPNGANKDGSLNTLLTAGTKVLRGNGQLGNQTIKNLSEAVQAFGDNSGPLFDSVKNMSQLTTTLAANDRFVDGFMDDLSSVSTELAGDRGQLAAALDALAKAVGTVRTFVHDNKGMVESDVRQLTEILGVLAKRKDELNTATRIGALGLDNLTVAYDNKTKSIGSRLNTVDGNNQPIVVGPGALLCDLVEDSPNFSSADKTFYCQLFNALVAPASDKVAANPKQTTTLPAQIKMGNTVPVTSLAGLLSALKAGNEQ